MPARDCLKEYLPLTPACAYSCPRISTDQSGDGADLYQPVWFHRRQRRRRSVCRFDIIGQHPLWDGGGWRQFEQRHGVRGQHGWFGLYQSVWFHRRQRRRRSVCRFDIIQQHPLWDGVGWRQFGQRHGVRGQHGWLGLYQPAWFHRRQRRKRSVCRFDIIQQHPLWDDGVWRQFGQRHGVRGQHGWLGFYQPAWFHRRRRRRYSDCQFDIIGQHPLWDGVGWRQFGQRHGVRGQHGWFGFYQPVWFHRRQRRKRSVCRFDIIKQHPLWDGVVWRQFGQRHGIRGQHGWLGFYQPVWFHWRQ